MKSFSLYQIIFVLASSVWLIFAAGCSKDSNNFQSADSSSGIGGSTARFTIVGNYLYLIDNSNIITYDISGSAPSLSSTTKLGMDIETIYPYQDKLFIGSATGMFVMDISEPANPVMEGAVAHLRACDPVVADDNYAYVTLRTGVGCGGFISALEVYNISDVRYPAKIAQVDMKNPHGLALLGNALYVCDNEWGLKVFDVTVPDNPVVQYSITNEHIYKDCIAYDNTLFCMVSGGMVIFDISDPFEPVVIAEV